LDDEDERFLDELPLLDLLLDDDLFTDPLLDRLLFDDRFTVEREELLLLLVLFTPDDEDDLLLLVIPSKAAFPNARPSDLRNPDDRFCLLLLFAIRFGTVAFIVLLLTAVRLTDRLKTTDLRLIVVLVPTLIRFSSDRGAT